MEVRTQSHPTRIVGLAFAKDGIRWHKPLDLGIVKYKGSGANNILIRNCCAANGKLYLSCLRGKVRCFGQK